MRTSKRYLVAQPQFIQSKMGFTRVVKLEHQRKRRDVTATLLENQWVERRVAQRSCNLLLLTRGASLKLLSVRLQQHNITLLATGPSCQFQKFLSIWSKLLLRKRESSSERQTPHKVAAVVFGTKAIWKKVRQESLCRLCVSWLPFVPIEFLFAEHTFVSPPLTGPAPSCRFNSS